MNLSLKKVEANRNFANKLWNATRLVISSLAKAPAAPQAEAQWTLADAWIWGRTKELTRTVERLFQTYQYGEAGRQIYDFFWSEFADWYLEIAKLQLAEGGDRAFYTADLMVRVLDICLRMLHPFTPFVTEELWQHLRQACQAHSDRLLPVSGVWEEALIVAAWPEPIPDQGWEEENIREFNLFQEVVRTIRNFRSEKNIKPSQKLSAILVEGEERQGLYDYERRNLAAVAGLDQERVQVVQKLEEKPEGHIALVAGPIQILLPFSEMVDTDEERARLQKELDDVQAQITRLQQLLAGSFAEKAPPAVVQKERDKLAAYQQVAEKITSQLKALS